MRNPDYGAALRACSDNRARYIAQSALTRNGRVARLPSLRQAVRFLKRKEVTPK